MVLDGIVVLVVERCVVVEVANGTQYKKKGIEKNDTCISD